MSADKEWVLANIAFYGFRTRCWNLNLQVDFNFSHPARGFMFRSYKSIIVLTKQTYNKQIQTYNKQIFQFAFSISCNRTLTRWQIRNLIVSYEQYLKEAIINFRITGLILILHIKIERRCSQFTSYTSTVTCSRSKKHMKLAHF